MLNKLNFILIFCTIFCAFSCTARAKRAGSFEKKLQASVLHQRLAAKLWQKASKVKKVKVRVQLAKVLGNITSKSSVPRLLSMFSKEKVRMVQKALVFALGQQCLYHNKNPLLIKKIGASLVRGYTRLSVHLRIQVVESLGKCQNSWLVDNVDKFKSEESHLRATFLYALLRYYRQLFSKKRNVPSSVISKLKLWSKDKSPMVKRAVAYFFWRGRVASVGQQLKRLCADTNKYVRMFATYALVHAQPNQAKLILPRLLHDPAHEVVVAALSVHSKFGLDLPLKAMESLVKNKNFHVRYGFLKVVKKNFRPSLKSKHRSHKRKARIVKKLVVRLSKDKYKTVSSSALELLATIATKHPRIESIRAIFKGRNHWLERLAYYRVLAKLPFSSHLALEFSNAMKNEDKRVIPSILRAMNRKELGSLRKKLLYRALESKQLSIRGEAVSLLSQQKDCNCSAKMFSVYKQSLGSQWLELRETIAKKLVDSNHRKIRQWLVFMLKDRNLGIRKLAARALKKHGIIVSNHRLRPNKPRTRSLLTSWIPKNRLVEFRTNRGTFVVSFYPKGSPHHVRAMYNRIKRGFYNGLSWHRVIANFVIQGGDPDNTGWGNAGRSIPAEIHTAKYGPGVLGMPRSAGWDTGSVQLFFTLIPTPHLDGFYTPFGKVVKGFENLQNIERGDVILQARFK